MIKCFPCIIVISSLAHRGIRHRQPTQARVVQITECMRRDFRHQLLHHRRPRLLPFLNSTTHSRHVTISLTVRIPTRAAATASFLLIIQCRILPLRPLHVRHAPQTRSDNPKSKEATQECRHGRAQRPARERAGSGAILLVGRRR